MWRDFFAENILNKLVTYFVNNFEEILEFVGNHPGREAKNRGKEKYPYDKDPSDQQRVCDRYVAKIEDRLRC